jgi:hypothetical protein
VGELIAGDPLWADELTIPDDSDPPTAAAVNPALEALTDRTSWLREQRGRQSIDTFTSTLAVAEVTVPEGAYAAICEGWGGGGGGGAGAAYGATDNADRRASGGGGGGGALRRLVVIACTPGHEWEVTVGAGGTGGLSSGDNGTSGSPSKIHNATTATDLVTWHGGDFGRGGQITTGPLDIAYGLGGGPVQIAQTAASNIPSEITNLWPEIDLHRQVTPSAGSHGVTSNATHGGIANRSPEGFAGGLQGADNVTQVGSYYGGGGGGGGGGGPGGAGANGVAGAAPNNAGVGANGTSAGFAAANSGAGGGGGGAAGGGSTLGSVGGSGGTGGSGLVRIMWLIRGDD